MVSGRRPVRASVPREFHADLSVSRQERPSIEPDLYALNSSAIKTREVVIEVNVLLVGLCRC